MLKLGKMIARLGTLNGRVQGVGFRYFMYQKACELSIRGWVRNLEDGSVEVHAEGSEDQVQDFFLTIRSGPRLAVVNQVDVQEAVVENLAHFSIRY